MGEVEPLPEEQPEKQPVTQVVVEAVPIDGSKVVVPASEAYAGVDVVLTKSDQKWCRFVVHTSERDIAVEPGSIEGGQDAFDALCEVAAAMLKTEEGSAFLGALRNQMSAKPLEIKAAVAPKETE